MRKKFISHPDLISGKKKLSGPHVPVYFCRYSSRAKFYQKACESSQNHSTWWLLTKMHGRSPRGFVQSTTVVGSIIVYEYNRGSDFFLSTLERNVDRTGGQFACRCVHPLNDNSVGAIMMAGNRKLA